MKSATRAVLLFGLTLVSPRLLASQDDYAATIMAGISNHGHNGGEPYVTAGDRDLIGTQDGNFPDLGDHVPGKMGGLWVHPIKLIDGFWATVRDSLTGQAAMHKTVVFDPHPPRGWKDMSIEDLPVGTNLISFSRAETGQGIQYSIEAKQSGWSFVLKGNPLPGAKYYLNGNPVSFTSSGIRMSERTNQLLVVQQ